MSAVVTEKWIDRVSAESRVSEVAERILRNRLTAVQEYLPLAAQQADEDPEHVHQLRVWTRRATAAARFFEDLMPRRRLAWIRNQLRRIRRAAKEARDCDVLLARLTGEQSHPQKNRWWQAVQEERARAQGALVAVHDRLERNHRFSRRIGKLLDRMSARGEEQDRSPVEPFGNWARARLEPVVDQFFAVAPTEKSDEAALHQFRIRGKELRYAMELVAAVLPEEFRTGLYPAVEGIQDRLGVINDLVAARAGLRQKIESAREPSEAEDWGSLLASEQLQIDQALEEFRAWCTPRRLDDLRSRFQRILADPSPNPKQPSPAGPGPASQRRILADFAPTQAAAKAGCNGGASSKIKMVGELGEGELLIPALVNEALAANDRAKYLMTLLQTAQEHADAPDLVSTDLRQERLAVGLAESELDMVVSLSRRVDQGTYRIPWAGRIHDRLVAEIRQMLAPIQTLDQTHTELLGRGSADAYEHRLQRLVARSRASEDRIEKADLDRITSGLREDGDSLHLLVMDLHRELNRLQQQLATDQIGGAFSYGILASDRPLITAFMAGVNRTRGLKFDHPGLGTTATRSGQRLVIQNDIGMTEAHVLVIHVEGMQVTLTYTDIHIERLVFFQNLFDRFPVGWNDPLAKRAPALGEQLYHLCLGTFIARDQAELEAYLGCLGSRLVFLIDWNRARKRLRKFAPRRVCLEVLRWAADNDLGHMGFLVLGGERLIFDALEAAGTLPLPPGAQLSDFLGAERTAEFLKFTLRTASEGLRGGRSEFFIRDEISAELRHYIDTAHQGLLEVAAEHAALIVELAMAARDVLLLSGQSLGRERLPLVVERARKWEHCADELVGRGRSATRRGDEPGPIFNLLTTADDVADLLEDAIFRLSLLLPDQPERSGAAPLQDLAALLVQGAQEYLKAVENARLLHRGSTREQVGDFLEAVDRTITIEHQTDDAHRRAQATIREFSGDFKQWHLFIGVADNLEGAADALMRSVLILRDDILAKVLRR